MGGTDSVIASVLGKSLVQTLSAILSHTDPPWTQ